MIINHSGDWGMRMKMRGILHLPNKQVVLLEQGNRKEEMAAPPFLPISLSLSSTPKSFKNPSLLLHHHHHFPKISATSSSSSTTTTSQLPSSTVKNYRPAIILPGLGNNSTDYSKLQMILRDDYDVPSVVANVSRIDWFRNAAGLVDPNYWSGTLRPRPVLDWYLMRIDEAVQQAKLQFPEQGGNGSLSLIGHSAGGWLARLYMEEFGISNISLLLTLGSPLMPSPKGVPGVIDQTRGLLDYVDKNCAGAVYTPELKYVCIAGRYIQGSRLFPNSDVDSKRTVPTDNDQPVSEVAVVNNMNNSTSTTLQSRFIGQGYKQVCGQADVWGDGVVPEVSAHLEGALNISFDGVYHSPVGSDDIMRPWYGSPAVVEKWVHHLQS